MQVSSELSLNGKLFVEFVALIYLSYVKKKMQDAGLFQKWTLQGLLDELDTIERFESPEHGRLLGEVTKKQEEIYTALGVDPPSLLTISVGALIVAAFTITSSISQPIFGYLIDQKGQRWMVYVGTLWMAVLLGFTGFISNTVLLIIVAAAAGMGTAAFHPQAAAMVGKASDKNKGLVMSAFIAMGNLGLAISPLLLLPLFHYYGVQYTWLAILPGALAALLLYRYAPRIYKPKGTHSPGLSQVTKDPSKSSSDFSS